MEIGDKENQPSSTRPLYGQAAKIGKKLVRFGPNELDFDGYELRRNGIRIPLSRLPLDLLILLVRRHGTLVTRDEIAALLWKEPELVDAVGGINTAIKKIRSVLNDDAGQPRYIETVVGRGYRFIGTIESVELTPPPRPPDADEQANRQDVLTSGSLPELKIETLAAQALLPPVSEPDQHVRKKPAWGSWVGTWRGTASLVATAGVLLIGLGAFKHSKQSGTQLLTGTQITSNDSENRVEAGAISPNGKLLAYIDPDGVFLRELETGSTRQLRLPVSVRGERMEWFSDDVRLLLSGVNTQNHQSELWKLSIIGTPAQLIRQDARNGVPSPDGARVAFTARNDTEIWTAGANGERAQRFIKASAGEQFSSLFWGGLGKRLSYQIRRELPLAGGRARHSMDENYEWHYVSRDLENAQQTAWVKGLRFRSACETTDGRLFYLHTSPWQDGSLRGIWEVSVENASGTFRSHPRQLATTEDYTAYGLTASSNGNELAAVWERGQADVYVAALEPGPQLANVRRFTLNTKRDFPHAWTADSAAVLFESDRAGSFHLFRQGLTERAAQQLTDMRGQQILPQATPDGKWILYESLREQFPSGGDALYRISPDGGQPQEVPLPRPLGEFRCPLLSGSCVLREVWNDQMFVFSALDPVNGQGRELARTAQAAVEFGSWALAPDGRTAALPIPDEHGSKVRLVPLDAIESGRRETTLALKSPGLLLSLNWSTDGAGWFGENRQNEVSSLLYLDRSGQQHVLRETTYPTWGVPSPDGRRLAFVDYTSDRNVWLWKR